MVAIAQLVESRIVIPVVKGSSPFSHPILSIQSRGSGEIGRRTRFRFWRLRCKSSSLFSRTTLIVFSTKKIVVTDSLRLFNSRGSGEIGRRTRFRFWRLRCKSSSLFSRTTFFLHLFNKLLSSRCLVLFCK